MARLDAVLRRNGAGEESINLQDLYAGIRRDGRGPRFGGLRRRRDHSRHVRGDGACPIFREISGSVFSSATILSM